MKTSRYRNLTVATRREILAGAAGILAATAVNAPVSAAAFNTDAASNKPTQQTGIKTVSFIKTKDGTEIYYKDWGSGQPIVFHHGWPLSSDDWDAQMLFFLQHGYRVIAHDRRGHGRSTQTSHGHDMDTYAQDAAAVVGALNLTNAVHIGHSTGGGEVAGYVARYGKGRVAKAVLVSSVPPLMLKTDR
jgi:non-heme chloroperoxidase